MAGNKLTVYSFTVVLLNIMLLSIYRYCVERVLGVMF